jgi:hypothetical protein
LGKSVLASAGTSRFGGRDSKPGSNAGLYVLPMMASCLCYYPGSKMTAEEVYELTTNGGATDFARVVEICRSAAAVLSDRRAGCELLF